MKTRTTQFVLGLIIVLCAYSVMAYIPKDNSAFYAEKEAIYRKCMHEGTAHERAYCLRFNNY